MNVPIPPFTLETATDKVKKVESAWNTQNPEAIVQKYAIESEWRNRDERFKGREAIELFLKSKWLKEKHYRLMMELWAFTRNRISVRFEYEWQDVENGCWFRTHGNVHWEFDEEGLIKKQDMSANDILILESQRKLK
ncbi:DUF1348 family protein [uncultured Roseivirga sp.]|uniref:DUF1348 family protein n=1 Tax=uncultured Roseivirga sp. TaxID=543088 RepID=UPI000D7AD3DF|nr:DUF1348 family protein [uncultured Roseivirga sp.]PWL31754.1 MAG: DUF1348 domain-containing protein [Roseivirga sp. XM-24bin3]